MHSNVNREPEGLAGSIPDPDSALPPDGTFFKVPLGVAPDGSLARAQSAQEGTEYRCPGCGSPVVLRRGPVRAAHFAHKASAFCSPETALHRGVKTLVATMLRRRLTRRRAALPKILVPCLGANWHRNLGLQGQCRGKVWFHLASLAYDQVVEEGTTSEGLRPDVLVLHQGRPVLGIEVLVSHAVDRAKAARATYPWVELEAWRFPSAPKAWRPCAASHPWAGRCQRCEKADEREAIEFSEPADAEECAFELAAACFEKHGHLWLGSARRRTGPTFRWRCPWCQRKNQRCLNRASIQGMARASSLGPPILPEVLIRLAGGPELSVCFGTWRQGQGRPMILPLADAPNPQLRVRADPSHPLRTVVIGTNRPFAFLCVNCGRDCLGLLPDHREPLSWSESLDWRGGAFRWAGQEPPPACPKACL